MRARFLQTDKQYITSVGLMLMSSACLALATLFAKYLTESFYLPLLIFLRFLVPGLLMWWIIVMTDLPRFPLLRSKVYFLRAVFVILSQYALFYYLLHGTILNATLLFMTSPLFVPLIEKVIYKKSLTWMNMMSLLVGFAGIIFILKPQTGIIAWPTLIGVASGFFNACSQVTFHKIAKKSYPTEISLWHYTICTFVAMIPLLFVWNHISWSQLSAVVMNGHYLLLFIGFGMAGISNQILRSHAYRKVSNLMSLALFLYTAVIFSAILDWVVFGITPDKWSIFGAILISLGGLTMLTHQSIFRYINKLKRGKI